MGVFLNTERMYAIAQVIRTLMPVMAGIGTVTSAIAFWRMFNKWNQPWILSWIFLPKLSKIIWGFSNRYMMSFLYDSNIGT